MTTQQRNQQRNQQINNDELMNEALGTMNLICEGSLQEKINVFLSYARSVSLKKLVDRSSTIKEKVELVSHFSCLYYLCEDTEFSVHLKNMIIKESGNTNGLNNSKPIDVSSLEEKMVWDMRTYAMNMHNTWSVRNSYFKSGRMDKWYEIEKRICLYTHSIIYELNEERKKTSLKQDKNIEKVDAIKETVKRQRRYEAPKKVLRKRSSKIDRKDFTGGLRQRSAKLDCKRRLRQYYLENDE